MTVDQRPQSTVDPAALGYLNSILWPRDNNQRGLHAKSAEQEEWELTTGISIRTGQEKLLKQLKGIKIEASENLNSSERKWTDLQYLDE